MAVTGINTLRYAGTLKYAGVLEAQAEAIGAELVEQLTAKVD